MKVAILTMFNGLTNTYSLVNVVAEHLRMLLDAGIETKVLVSEHCPDQQREGIFKDERLIWEKVINTRNGETIHWRDYSQPTGKVHDTFFEEAELIAADLVEKLKDIDVCMMHDIHYQGWHLLHNVAIRIAQEKLPHTRFLAFTHSAPVNAPIKTEWPLSARYTPMPKTLYIYPTHSGLSHLAKQYNVAEGRCRVVNNSMDILSFLHKDTQNIVTKTNLLLNDIVMVYPGRLTPGKKFEKVAMLGGAIKRMTEKTVKVIFCDFPSMDIVPKHYHKKIRLEGNRLGLSNEDIVFTSELGHEKGVPREVVLDLFSLSNLYVCPSYSESFGLTVLEAASKGNFIVVNEAVPALQELGKTLQAYFMRWDARNFGFDTTESYHPSEKEYLEEHAQIIVNMMRENHVIHAKTMSRQRYAPSWIWEHQLEPLINS